MRAQTVTKDDGKQYVELAGYASVTETPYAMADGYGGYSEVVSRGAFQQTLASDPDVVMLLNHTGLALARTVNGSLTLSEDDTGLHFTGLLNPARSDVSDLMTAVNDGVITECSFAFSIESAMWSPDYTELRINTVDINRGDVSPVNFAANPSAQLARSAFDLVNHLEAAQLRELMSRAASRLPAETATAAQQGRSVSYLLAQMEMGAL